MRLFLRQHWSFFLVCALAGLALRAFFAVRFPGVVDDSLLYADIAKNWLHLGIYGITDSGAVNPTYIRLPGYPAFLAAVFAAFGNDNYRAVIAIQVLADLFTCFVIADLARRTVGSPRAVKAAFLLAALCPFLANYSGIALTETFEILATALALDLAIAGLDAGGANRFGCWIGAGVACGAAILLRPDGGLVPASIGVYALLRWLRRPQRQFFLALIVFSAATFACLLPWTVRNWRTFHRFQPLAPRNANMPGDFVPYGFQRWAQTWIADYVSVEEIFWADTGKLDGGRLPSRAADSPEQRETTEELIDDYNQELGSSPQVDARFAALAEERIRTHPWRYYVWLPALRIADMWLRPRTEMLPVDTRWWEFDDDLLPSATAVVFGLLNFGYLAAAALGFLRRRLRFAGLLLLFLLLRTALLGTLSPEPRYTLEGYPIVLVAAAAVL